MGKLTKHARERRALARRLGFNVVEGKKHLKVMDNGELVALIPTRPSEHRRARGLRNFEASLLRRRR